MNLTIEELQAIETEIVKEVALICKRNNIDYFLHCGSVLGAIRHGGPIPWDTDVDMIIPYNQYDNFIDSIREELSDKFYVDYYDVNNIYPALFARIGLKGYSTKVLHVDLFKLVGVSPISEEQKQYTKKSKLFRDLYFPKKQTEKYYGKTSFKRKLYYRILKILLLPFSDKWIIKKFENHCNLIPFKDAEFVTNPSGHYGMKNILPKAYYGKGKYVQYADFEVRIPEKYHEYLINYYGDYMSLPPKEERRVKENYKIIKSPI